MRSCLGAFSRFNWVPLGLQRVFKTQKGVINAPHRRVGRLLRRPYIQQPVQILQLSKLTNWRFRKLNSLYNLKGIGPYRRGRRREEWAPMRGRHRRARQDAWPGRLLVVGQSVGQSVIVVNGYGWMDGWMNGWMDGWLDGVVPTVIYLMARSGCPLSVEQAYCEWAPSTSNVRVSAPRYRYIA